jgi:hypothetical protein
MHKCRSSASAGDGSEFWKNSVTCIRFVVLHALMCTHMLPAYSRTNYEAIHIHWCARTHAKTDLYIRSMIVFRIVSDTRCAWFFVSSRGNESCSDARHLHNAIYVREWKCLYTQIQAEICTYNRVHRPKYLHACNTHMHTRTYICVYIHIHACMHTYIHAHTHTHQVCPDCESVICLCPACSTPTVIPKEGRSGGDSLPPYPLSCPNCSHVL